MINLSALSNIPIRSVPPSVSLVFGTGITLGPVVFVNTTQFTQDFSGIDSVTGDQIPNSLYPIFDTGATLRILHIPDAPCANAAALALVQAASLQSGTDGTPGARELLLNMLSRVSGNPQMNFIISRPAVGSYPTGSPPVKDVPKASYEIRYYVDSNLASNLAVNNYYTVWESKSGGWLGGYSVGDFRAIARIVRSSGGLVWEFDLDNEVNGNGTIPSVTNEFTNNGGIRTIYQHSQTAFNSVVTGWHKLRVYIKRPANRADTVTGKSWFTVQPDNGAELLVGKFEGGIQMGTESLPWTRIFIANNYTSGALPAIVKVGPFYIWDKLQDVANL